MNSPRPLRTRFAPTPSGFLHWGNAFSFVVTWLTAKQAGGEILLRIDDLDAARKRPEYVEDVFRSLEWLGLDFDLGPTGPDDFEAHFSQRHRLELYHTRLDGLKNRSLLFGCECSRGSIQRDSADGKHPASCRAKNHSLERADVAWRIETPATPIRWNDRDGRAFEVGLHTSMKDFVVRRKDGIPAYQIASLVDDELYHVNLVVRGQDLIDSTASQLWLADVLDSDFRDASFLHHKIVSDDAGEKLSKSAGARSLKMIRELDVTPANLFQEMSPMLGFAETVSSAIEALAAWNDLP